MCPIYYNRYEKTEKVIVKLTVIINILLGIA